MEKCLITNEICSNTNKKCKTCKLDECNEVFNMLDIHEKNIQKEQLDRLKRKLPEQCRNCSFLEIINSEHYKVKCFYKIKNKCILK